MKTPLRRLIGTYMWFNLGLYIHEWLEPKDYWPNKDEIIEQVYAEYRYEGKKS